MDDDDRYRPPRKPIPLVLWALIGFVVVLAFLFFMRAMNPPSAGMSPPTPDIVAPKS